MEAVLAEFDNGHNDKVLPSQFQPNDNRIIEVDFGEAGKFKGKVKKVSFTASKVFYDIEVKIADDCFTICPSVDSVFVKYLLKEPKDPPKTGYEWG